MKKKKVNVRKLQVNFERIAPLEASKAIKVVGASGIDAWLSGCVSGGCKFCVIW